MGYIQANEPDTSICGNIPVGLYYYYIHKSKLSEANYLGWVSTIQSVTYNPFIDENDLSLYVNSFDTTRFGTPSGGIPKCYRIATSNIIEKVIGTIKPFPNKNELNNYDIKLYCYPFRYFIITDYMNTPLLIKPELIVNGVGESVNIKITTAPLSQNGKYLISVDNYKSDNVGNLEGIVNSNSLMLPVSSDAYSQFIATSSSSFHQGNINAMLENDVTLKQGLNQNAMSQIQNNVSTGFGVIGNLLSGNLGGALSTGVNGYLNNYTLNMNADFMRENHSLKESVISTMANAKISDMISTPKSMLTCGNDSLFNLFNSRQKIDLIEYRADTRKLNLLNQHFKRYGYLLNNYKSINIHVRKYYTYVKTSICNIQGEIIPHKDLEEIKNIFNSGITFWDISTGVKVGNYNIDNGEV